MPGGHSGDRLDNVRVAVLIPCYNEEISIGRVVRDFSELLPQADIFVYDNNSDDRTREIAAASGAIVRRETMQGKGHVVRRMFSDIEADYYILVDGDATYDASAVPDMLAQAATQGLDMVNGARVTDQAAAYRRGHVLGNRVLTGLVMSIFGHRMDDMLSGYRVFSRRFVKSFPISASGFEIETELTVHALELDMPISEITTRYFQRIDGSTSKLRTYHDGLRILKTIFSLIQREKPLPFYLFFCAVFAASGLLIGNAVIMEYLRTGLVPRLPSAVLATGLMLLSGMCLLCGIVLNAIKHARLEIKKLAYLSHAIRIVEQDPPAPGPGRQGMA
ncbi:glycosyltransferase family 2 protein [Novacetimonas pomaceti]|uniref:Glycosyl transferase family 2 n=1 Tax=Novacetimonas pomaceti TaxID=2021998 RepID=A0ABX5P4C7_9PROT|nr:glycosyltransferase family 2 protein [Novacetimonas pomaceti]PYD47146.1 glycosyl transferase family 2 [Novacetimonas pomaceti]